MRSCRFFSVILLCVFSLLPTTLVHAVSPKQLSPYFRKWIEEDVVYIITQEERREFLKLQTDDEREHFIAEFWEARNPSPHSAINSYKEEHYRRLAYVRANFGDDRYDDGWRTDMGRVYITLGPPQQRANFHQGISTRPVEIWFYYSPTPALPPTFNLVFYKPSETEDYKLYSPRSDGPTKIVTNDSHDDAEALHSIDQSMGAEAAHAMVSLLPNEPVSIDHPDPSMESDILLSMIRSLPEQKLEKQRIERLRGVSKEVVTSSLFTGFNATDLQAVVLHDEHGLSTVHYIVRHVQPDPSVLGLLPDKQNGYKQTLVTRVSTATGKAVYERREELSGVVSAEAAQSGKEKAFAAEGRLPLSAGKYTIEAVLTNDLTRESSRSMTTVTVPAPQQDAIAMSGIMVYRDRPVQTQRDQLPFTIAGVRFPPRGEQRVELHAGEKLPFAYQLWLPRNEVAPVGSTGEAARQSVHVHYTLGSVTASGASGSRIEEDEDIPVKDVDDAGDLLTGHSLDTATLGEGTYRLVVKATMPGVGNAASATMTVKIVPAQVAVAMWTAYGDEKQHPAWEDNLLRGLAAEAMEDKAAAVNFYRRVLAAKPDAVEAQNRLDRLTKTVAARTPAAP